MQAQTIEVIKSTVPLLEEHGRSITDVFYQNLFLQHPYLKNIFNMANQGKGEQSHALSDAVLAYAKNIENLEALLPAVARIAHKHVSLGVQPKHYAVIGETLLAAIQEVLSLPDDHPALAAWGEAYGVLADVFIQAEAAIVQDNRHGAGGWEGYRDFYVEKIVAETPEVKSIYFKPIDLEAIPDFKGGQYVGVRVRPNDSEHYQIRQYSLSKKGDMRISVKAEHEGLVSNFLHNCQVGDGVSLQAPTGVFNLSKTQPKHIFLAGGVGITPMMSMMEEAIEGGASVDDLLFIQCAKDEDHQIFQQDLVDLKSSHGFNHKKCFENSSAGDHQGYLSKEVIADWTQTLGFSPDNAQVYFCGPKSFMAVLNQFFLELGYGENDIHYEVFGPTTSL